MPDERDAARFVEAILTSHNQEATSTGRQYRIHRVKKLLNPLWRTILDDTKALNSGRALERSSDPIRHPMNARAYMEGAMGIQGRKRKAEQAVIAAANDYMSKSPSIWALAWCSEEHGVFEKIRRDMYKAPGPTHRLHKFPWTLVMRRAEQAGLHYPDHARQLRETMANGVPVTILFTTGLLHCN